jgi:hypothetical protein
MSSLLLSVPAIAALRAYGKRLFVFIYCAYYETCGLK